MGGFYGYGEREVMEGFLPWSDGDPDPGQTILVRARRMSPVGTGRPEIDHTAEILDRDTPDSLTAFAISQVLYEGEDRRGIPTSGYDDDFSRFGS